MAINSSAYQIPFYNPAPEPVFLDTFPEKTPEFTLYEELNSISEEIEKCRRQASL